MKKNIKTILISYIIFIFMISVYILFIINFFTKNGITKNLKFDIAYSFIGLSFFQYFIALLPLVVLLLSGLIIPAWFLIKKREKGLQIYIIILSILALISITSFMVNPNFKLDTNTKFDNDFKIERVVHAGGEINNMFYTNSIDALNQSYEKGFSYFEMDLSFTKDNKLVCLHD